MHIAAKNTGTIMSDFVLIESVMLLVIDNYDSFTYNIVQYLRELGADVNVLKNDAISAYDIDSMSVDRIVVSPGPCTPNESGISMAVVERFSGRVPILGVCLGHQCIGQLYGGKVIKAKQVMHGKTSMVFHSNGGLFKGLDNPFRATRYHSLVVETSSLSEDFEISAWTQNATGEKDEVMGISHSSFLLEGVQFHPESILSENGHMLLQNFLNI